MSFTQMDADRWWRAWLDATNRGDKRSSTLYIGETLHATGVKLGRYEVTSRLNRALLDAPNDAAALAAAMEIAREGRRPIQTSMSPDVAKASAADWDEECRMREGKPPAAQASEDGASAEGKYHAAVAAHLEWTKYPPACPEWIAFGEDHIRCSDVTSAGIRPGGGGYGHWTVKLWLRGEGNVARDLTFYADPPTEEGRAKAKAAARAKLEEIQTALGISR